MSIIRDIGNLVRGKNMGGFIVGGLPSDGTKWNGKDRLAAADISLYTDRAISKRAEKVGEIDFFVKNKKTGDAVENHPILDLLKQPNDMFAGYQFWALYQHYFDYIGEVYIVIEMGEREIFEPKYIGGLHLPLPTKMKTHWNENGIAGYTYQTGTQNIPYSPTQVIRVINPDLKDPRKGRSLITSGTQAIQTEVQIGAYHSRVLENGGKVEGVFKFKTPRLQRAQLAQLKGDYQKEYADARKSGMPLFLGGDSDYIRTGLSPDELSFLEAKKTTLDDIVIMTGTPKSLLGSVDDVQYSNAESSHRIFLRETVNPLLRNLASALDKVLVGEGEELTYVDPTPQNVEEQVKLIESGVKNYLMTPNEGRRLMSRLLGEELPDVPEGNQILVPFNMIPIGDASVVSKEGDSKGKKKANDDDTESVAHPLRDPAVRKAYFNVQIKRMDAREKPFKREVKNYFKEQRDRLIDTLQPNETRVFRRKGLLDDSLNLELEATIGQEKFVPLVAELVKQAGVDALDLMGSEYDFNVSSVMTSWMKQRADVFVRRINDTTFNKLTEQFAESLAAGESRKDLIKRIEQTYKDISIARAATIARTEVHNATQYGTMEGYKQAGMTIKIWASVRDHVTRDSHYSLDGEERPMDKHFSNGLMWPGDPAGPAEEVVNCRCVI